MIGVVYYSVYLLSGIFFAALLFDEHKRHQVIILGLAIGTMLCAWLPAGFSLLLGKFDGLSNLIALFILLSAVFLVLYKRRNEVSVFRLMWQRKDLDDERTMLYCAVPFLFLITWMFSGHVLIEKSGSLYGGQSTYGDLSMHLGMITSIARQGIFPPEYSILPGARLSYPFLVNSLSASLYLFGSSLRTAVIYPSIVMSFICFAGFFMLAKRVSGKNKSAVTAVLLFFITGGLGVIYFFGDANMFKEIFTGYYRTPVNLPELNLRWVNVICDMMVPQRTTLMGWSMLIPTMFLLYDGIKKGQEIKPGTKLRLKDRKELIAAGAMAGLMPMIHTHSFLALGILCAGMLITGLFIPSINKKQYMLGFLIFAIPVAVFAPPQLIYWVFTQTEGFVRKSLDWVNEGWPWLKFWVVNVGLPFLLIIPAVIWGRKKYFIPFIGAMLIYAIAERIAFQPNLYDNNKLLLVWYMVMCIMIGDFIVYAVEKIKPKAIRYITATVLALVLFTSGSLSIIREIKSNGDYQLYNQYHMEAAEAIDYMTFTDSLFLTGRQHLNAPAALAGRNIYVGSATYLFFHGFNLTEREQKVETMYTDAALSADMMAQENIDYIYFSSYESYFYDTDEGMFDIYPVVFQNREVTIYAVSERAKELGYIKGG